MPESPIIEQVSRFRAAQARRETQELKRLVDAYRVIYKAAQRDADALMLAIEANGGTMTRGQLVRLQQYKNLMRDVVEELEKYKAFVSVEIGTASAASITEGERAARVLARLVIEDAGISAQFRTLNPAVIETLLGFLDRGGPLYKRLDGLPKWTAEQMAEAILEGIGMGKNPRTIGGIITRTLGMGLTDSMRMMRTVQLWSYREANRASYNANSDVVQGWVWYAELDDATCASCVAQHGSVHPLDEPLNDHHNGRCAMVPLVIGAPNQITAGADWFTSQSEETQKAILGASKWDAWKNGKFDLAEVSGVKADPVYGDMRVEKSLKELLPE